MKDTLIAILSQFCPGKVYLQGTINENESYPETFLTFWTDYTEDRSHYDNDVTSIDWNFSVILYSSNPSNLGTIPGQIRAAMIAAGFIPQGRGNDIPSDVSTHTGWAMEFIKTEFL